ncbi:SIR2 family protein [Rhodoplanes sp. TEM]|uniref:SIR2 family protein n=1 Tax=Rhodoplanes tepidamans TaxID=200616 RepID=A0ABT5JFL9_RHOTP|nr:MULTISPECIES: SIR2 family protein [Rhodoplanes]MDC7788089.1 SIR2 family protein [Rhodoplanes tepidamans]MDC7987774.1 SIR2 family protein [Rhodoplanes sp. TEM]MDQ0355621.1 tetratricopeptide (TPR) repeat protein [Rhodoplanes tepidamans]
MSNGLRDNGLHDAAWPYNWEAATALLDPRRIEAQGRFFLCRALNTRRLVAFVGAGASMAYGRVSWGELGGHVVTGILDTINASESSGHAQPGPIVSLKTQLKNLLVEVKAEKSDAIMLAMQIAEQIWILADKPLLNALESHFCIGETERDLPPSRKSDLYRRDRFRRSIKQATYDETHHVRRILSNPYNDRDSIDAIARGLAHTSMTRFPGNHSRRLHNIFSTKVVSAARDYVGSLAPQNPHVLLALSTAILDRLSEELSVSHSNSRAGLDPVNYHALGFAIDLIRTFHLLTKTPPKDGMKTIAGAIAPDAALSNTVPIRRTEIASPDKDPLWHLAVGLEVGRFVTTNYDLEIERLIDQLGFKRTTFGAQDDLSDDEIERIGPMGGRARDIVLGENNAVDLLDFAAGANPHSIQVVHVHGRATDEAPLVVTDRDYQDQYIGDERHKVLFRQGSQILFGGNPILFVGVGLSEGDLMRPLREFAGEHIRGNHSVVALRPATEPKAKRDKFTLEQYIRHGVYVLHYGILGPGDVKPSSDEEPPDPSWLARVFELTETIVASLDGLPSSPRTRSPRQAFEGLLDFLGAPADPPRDPVTSGIDLGPPLSRNAADAVCKKTGCSIGLELQLLAWIGTLVEQHGASLLDELSDGPKEKAISLLKRTVRRIEDAIRIAALTACLKKLESDWQTWSTEWLAIPQSRIENLESPPKAARLERPRWTRHIWWNPPAGKNRERDTLRPDRSMLDDLVAAWPRRDSFRAPGRRIVFVAAPRGGGKGGLHRDLTECSDRLLEDNPIRIEPRRNATGRHYAAIFSASFSFFSEIASVWDALTAFLLDPLRPASDTLVQHPMWTGGQGRIAALAAALDGTAAQLKQTAGRLHHRCGPVEARGLILLNAFGLAFEADGYPKSAEIRAIFDLLTSPDRADLPLDLVFLVRDTRLPLHYRIDPPPSSPSDRRDKCEPRTLRLLSAPSVRDLHAHAHAQEQLAAAVRRSGVRLAPGFQAAGSPVSSATRGPVPPADDSYIYFIPATVAADHASGPPIASRFHATLATLLDKDLETLKRIDYLTQIRGSIGNLPDVDGRIDPPRFVERVLDYWAARPYLHDLDKDRFRTLREEQGESHEPERFDDLLRCAHDSSLLELLIRHLAVISMPVEADILLECPMIERRVEDLSNSFDGRAAVPIRHLRLDIVRYALALLSARGLVFTLEPRIPPVHEDGVNERPAAGRTPESPRYQVHRTVQLHAYRKLGAQYSEPPDTYNFSVSLYASQARELPALSANAYAFLHDLVTRMIGFPTLRSEFEPASCTDADSGSSPGEVRTFEARRLRAGIGIARTLFSLGVVARFCDIGGISVPKPPRSGYFEHHRLILRWMLHRAAALGGTPTRDGETEPSTASPSHLPFYRDEIVWLFNECGVFGLAQGSLVDTIAMLDAALRAARRIEGPAGGPIRRRVLLNVAECDIMRGRLKKARRLLDEVRRESSEDETIRLIAGGYTALLDHLGGARDTAIRGYGTAIKGLVRLGRSRSVSLFLRHRGQLHRDMEDYDKAGEDLSASVNYARRSGFEDMAHLAMVAKARMNVARQHDLRQQTRCLEEAERYAGAMDIPILTAEASFVHAQILLQQGETALASDKAVKAIRIATLHGQYLRSIAYRSLLADILRERGWTDEATRIKGQALQAARSIGYRLLLQRHMTDSGSDRENTVVPQATGLDRKDADR